MKRFFKKTDEGQVEAGGDAGGGDDGGDTTVAGGFHSDPGKAARFFEHAQNMHDSTNFSYAMVLWLKGIKQDPTSMRGLEGFARSAAQFADDPKVKGPSKDQVSQLEGKSPVDRYAQALLQWGGKKFDWELGIKAAEAAAKIDMNEQGYWLGERSLAGALSDSKAKKAHFVRLLDLFEGIGAFDKAVIAGDTAMKVDPRDAKLEYRVKNMSAQATMTRGGFDQVGQEGGFRGIVKDSDKQRQLLEEDAVVKSQSTLEGLIERYRAMVADNPEDLPTIQKYVQYMLERGTPADEKTAYKVLMQTFEKTQSYRFKQQAGEVRLRVGRRKLREKKAAAAADPGDAALQSEYESFAKGLLEEEINEYMERVKHYPTDLNLKFELGRRLYDSGRYDEAIGQFQVAQNSAGIAGTVQNYLAMSFLQLGWLSEAVETFRGAITGHGTESDDLGMALRYGLMVALQRRAEEEEELAAAEEALKIAQKIAMHQISYRDIQNRRTTLQALVKQLKDAA